MSPTQALALIQANSEYTELKKRVTDIELQNKLSAVAYDQLGTLNTAVAAPIIQLTTIVCGTKDGDFCKTTAAGTCYMKQNYK